MNKEEKEALARIQRELIKEESFPDELQTEPDYLESIKELLGEETESMEQTVMFQIPEKSSMPEAAHADGLADYRDSDEEAIPSTHGDTRMTALIIIAILLTLGILGVLLRWLLLLK